MQDQTPHYECALTEELHPEDEMADISIYEVSTKHESIFHPDKEKHVRVNYGDIDSEIANVSLLVCNDELVAVKLKRASGTILKTADEADGMWEDVIDNTYRED